MHTFHVLTDFSAAAANALHYAVALARHLAGQVQLWHVLPVGAEAAFFQTSALTASPAQRYQQLVQQAEFVRQYVPCTAELLEGSEATGQLAQHLGQRLGQVVVVGNSNPAKAMSKARHSTALHLVQTLAQPLLVVPKTFQAGALPRRIVLDTDRRAVRLPAAASTVPALLAHLTAAPQPLTLAGRPGDVEELLTRVIPGVLGIHVYTSEAPPALEEVAYQLRQTGLLEGVAHTVAATRHSSIEEGIRHVAARHRADLLTFVTRQRMYAGPHFLQSVTAGLLAHSPIPVLTVPEA